MGRGLAIYLLFVNLLTFLVYWLDKRRASKRGRRISERELLLWALVGGSPAAAYAVRRLRHKSRKRSFLWQLYGIVLLQVVALYLAFQ